MAKWRDWRPIVYPAGDVTLTGYLGQLDVRSFRQLQQSRVLNNTVMFFLITSIIMTDITFRQFGEEF